MERFGKAGGSGAGAGKAAAQPKKDPIEVIKGGIKTTRTLYTEDRNPGVAKTCFKTLHVYLSNILKNPSEEKFRKINLANEAFQKRVGKVAGGLTVLKGAGFEEMGDETLLMNGIDEKVIKEAVRLLENNL